MNVTFNKTTDLTGTITVKLAPEDINDAYDRKIKKLSKSVSIPGFRPGHAPKAIIEKMYGQGVLLEEINSLANNALYDFIESEKIKILGDPLLNNDSIIKELNKNTEYSFQFDIGLSPEFDLNISPSDKFTKYKVNITDKMIDEEIEGYQVRYGEFVQSEQVGEKDTLYFKVIELNEGKELEGGVHAESVPVLLDFIKSENIRNKLLGSTKNSEFVFNIFEFFDHNEAEISHALGVQKTGVADLGPDFKFILTDIRSQKRAEINQELFDKIYSPGSVSNLEEFRNKIKEELSKYFEEQSNHLVEHELFDMLRDKHSINLPDDFLKQWLIRNYPDKFNKSNIDDRYVLESLQLKNHLFEDKIIETNNLKITDDKIKEAAYNYIKKMFGVRMVDTLRNEFLTQFVEEQLKKDDFKSRMINIAARKEVLNFLMNQVTLEEKVISEEEFLAIIQNHNKSHHHEHGENVNTETEATV